VLADDAEAQRTTVVLHVHAEAREADFLKKCFGNSGQVVERISEGGRRWHVQIAETGIIGATIWKSPCKRRDQVTVLIGRGREAVKEEKLRPRRITTFAIEDVESIDGASARVGEWRGLRAGNFHTVRLVSHSASRENGSARHRRPG
jgi:hypothetical protein